MAATKKDEVIETLAEAADETEGEFENGFTVTRLSARDSARFLEILESDEEPSPALLKAVEKHRRLIRRS